MMNNLFSSFDPSTNFNMSLNWLSTFIGLFLIPLMFWTIPSRLSMMYNKMNKFLLKELTILIKPKDLNNLIIIISLFSLIMFNNFLGLFPYIFTSTSHMILTLSLAFPLWISFMIFGWFNHTIHMLSHLVPLGTPNILMPFMVCIETISNFIRPGTLAIRLSANMIAGHLLLTLLGNTGPSIMTSMIIMLMIIQILLLTLESAVAIIQSYVFTILSTLYSSEI